MQENVCFSTAVQAGTALRQVRHGVVQVQDMRVHQSEAASILVPLLKCVGASRRKGAAGLSKGACQAVAGDSTHQRIHLGRKKNVMLNHLSNVIMFIVKNIIKYLYACFSSAVSRVSPLLRMILAQLVG